MATLVGDIILSVRQQIPDMPQVMPAPDPSVVGIAGNNLPNGQFPNGYTLFLKLTAVDAYGGETAPSSEFSATLGGSDNAFTIFATGAQIPPGAVAIKVYFGGASNQQNQAVLTNQQLQAGILDVQAQNSPYYVVTGPIGTPPTVPIYGGVPVRNTAWYPDTDGSFFSAAAMYRMLNAALDELTRRGGGITDVTGVQAINSVLEYRLPANFFNFTNVWYDGFILQVVKRSAIFMRNPVPGISGYCSIEHDGNSNVLTTFPQPSRTGNLTTLTAPMALTDTTASVAAWPAPGTGGAPGMGVVQIGSEQMVFSGINGTQLTGILRGVGGTTAVAHATGELATELNIRLVGKRTVPKVVPGSALNPLNLPPAWERACKFYMMSLVRKAEQDPASAAEELKQFEAEVVALAKASRQSTQPRNIMTGDESPEVYSPNAFGFGWIVN